MPVKACPIGSRHNEGSAEGTSSHAVFQSNISCPLVIYCSALLVAMIVSLLVRKGDPVGSPENTQPSVRDALETFVSHAGAGLSEVPPPKCVLVSSSGWKPAVSHVPANPWPANRYSLEVFLGRRAEWGDLPADPDSFQGRCPLCHGNGLK